MRKLNRPTDQRLAVLRSLATNLLWYGKIETTAAKAKELEGYHSSTAIGEFTAENTFSKLKSMLAAGKLRRYKARGTLIMYVRSEIMDNLENTQIAEGGLGIETRVTDIDGVPVMEVIDDERFYDAFNWEPANGGFEPANGAHKLNVLIACGETCKTVHYWYDEWFPI